MFKLGVPMMQNFTMAQTIWTNLLCTVRFSDAWLIPEKWLGWQGPQTEIA
jgi:hypothetical protein